MLVLPQQYFLVTYIRIIFCFIKSATDTQALSANLSQLFLKQLPILHPGGVKQLGIKCLAYGYNTKALVGFELKTGSYGHIGDTLSLQIPSLELEGWHISSDHTNWDWVKILISKANFLCGYYNYC